MASFPVPPGFHAGSILKTFLDQNRAIVFKKYGPKKHTPERGIRGNGLDIAPPPFILEIGFASRIPPRPLWSLGALRLGWPRCSRARGKGLRGFHGCLGGRIAGARGALWGSGGALGRRRGALGAFLGGPRETLGSPGEPWGESGEALGESKEAVRAWERLWGDHRGAMGAAGGPWGGPWGACGARRGALGGPCGHFLGSLWSFWEHLRASRCA